MTPLNNIHHPHSHFPVGTCINNTSVMMFKKGSFEIGGTIHPVAIKVKQIPSSSAPIKRGQLFGNFILIYFQIKNLQK